MFLWNSLAFLFLFKFFIIGFNSLAFPMILHMLAVWALIPLPFLNLVCTPVSLLLACEMSAVVQFFEHSLALPFYGIEMKMDLFQSRGHCWIFQICWHNECSMLTASSFRIWNSSVGIPSSPLALFVVILPWLYTPGCLALDEWPHHRGYLGH